MFDNIGKKIKNLASIITWVGIILSVTIGLVLAFVSYDFAIVGLVIIVVGSLSSWISSFLLYGVGQLVDNSDKLLRSKGINPYASNSTVKPDYLTDLLNKGLITEEDYSRRRREG